MFVCVHVFVHMSVSVCLYACMRCTHVLGHDQVDPAAVTWAKSGANATKAAEK